MLRWALIFLVVAIVAGNLWICRHYGCCSGNRETVVLFVLGLISCLAYRRSSSSNLKCLLPISARAREVLPGLFIYDTWSSIPDENVSLHLRTAAFFQNVSCVNCHRELGFLPDCLALTSLDPVEKGLWRPTTKEAQGALYKKCVNYEKENVCNWMVPRQEQDAEFCVSCRLNEIIPDLGMEVNRSLWARVEDAKRRRMVLHIDRPETSPRKQGFESAAGPCLSVSRGPDKSRRLDIESLDGPRSRGHHSQHRRSRRRYARKSAERDEGALSHSTGPLSPRNRPLLLGPPCGRHELP